MGWMHAAAHREVVGLLVEAERAVLVQGHGSGLGLESWYRGMG